MEIAEIIKIARDYIQNLEERVKLFYFKSSEHEELSWEIGTIENIILDIESCLHVPGVACKFNGREDLKYYLDLLRAENESKTYEILRCVEKDVEKTLLWAKKLSWFGDWDLNFDGRHSPLAITFLPDEGVKPFYFGQEYFWKADKLTPKHYRMEISSSESGLSDASLRDFSEKWEKLKFSVRENDRFLTFDATVFKWEKSKFSGFVADRPFYAERTSEFFGKDHTVYYSAHY